MSIPCCSTLYYTNGAGIACVSWGMAESEQSCRDVKNTPSLPPGIAAIGDPYASCEYCYGSIGKQDLCADNNNNTEQDVTCCTILYGLKKYGIRSVSCGVGGSEAKCRDYETINRPDDIGILSHPVDNCCECHHSTCDDNDSGNNPNNTISTNVNITINGVKSFDQESQYLADAINKSFPVSVLDPRTPINCDGTMPCIDFIGSSDCPYTCQCIRSSPYRTDGKCLSFISSSLNDKIYLEGTKTTSFRDKNNTPWEVRVDFRINDDGYHATARIMRQDLIYCGTPYAGSFVTYGSSVLSNPKGHYNNSYIPAKLKCFNETYTLQEVVDTSNATITIGNLKIGAEPLVNCCSTTYRANGGGVISRSCNYGYTENECLSIKDEYYDQNFGWVKIVSSVTEDCCSCNGKC